MLNLKIRFTAGFLKVESYSLESSIFSFKGTFV